MALALCIAACLHLIVVLHYDGCNWDQGLVIPDIQLPLIFLLIGCAPKMQHKLLFVHEVIECVHVVVWVLLANHNQLGPERFGNLRATLVHLRQSYLLRILLTL